MTKISIVVFVVLFLLGVLSGICICKGINKMAVAKKMSKNGYAKKKATKKTSKKK